MDRRLLIVISGVHRGASFDEVGCDRDSVVERRPLQGQEPVRVDGYAFVSEVKWGTRGAGGGEVCVRGSVWVGAWR